LFISDDSGDSWEPVAAWNDHPRYFDWNNPDAGTPDGSLMQWITIDPRDAAHMYLVTSEGGVFETLDSCASWRPLNRGVEIPNLPGTFPEFGQDTHCLQIHPARPDRLYQQSHCGIYRLDRPGDEWTRIGDNMPRDPDTAWVLPMDGTTVWPRTSPDGRPTAYVTHDAGASWIRQDRGLPPRNAWHTIKRQGFSADGLDPLGLYFGTTSGELWMSGDEGASWRSIAEHLPEIYSVTAYAV